jgi:hypothetical protein
MRDRFFSFHSSFKASALVLTLVGHISVHRIPFRVDFHFPYYVGLPCPQYLCFVFYKIIHLILNKKLKPNTFAKKYGWLFQQP